MKQKILNKIKKKNNGITLIALVITIIVLLILAAISIAMLTGQNGILTQAQNAKNKTEEAQIIEQIRLDIEAIKSEKQGEISENQYIDILEKYGDIKNNGSTLITKNGNFSLNISDIYPLNIDIMDITPVYAILYDNGTFVFNTTGDLYENMEEANIVLKTDDISHIIYDQSYDYKTPWNDYASTINKVIFEEAIAPESTSRWFSKCTNLTEIENIYNLHTENVTNMRAMFQSCNSLISLDLSNFNTRKVNTMQSMFENSSNLITVDLSNFDTKNVTNMQGMFNRL